LLQGPEAAGLLDETIVIWGGEFGRQPTAEYAQGTGRDHNAYGFTMWMAGGRHQGGHERRRDGRARGPRRQDRFHVKNLHATVLHQMGPRPEQLSYFYGGLDQKLVGVEGAERSSRSFRAVCRRAERVGRSPERERRTGGVVRRSRSGLRSLRPTANRFKGTYRARREARQPSGPPRSAYQ
jgi:hypothetical protein